MNEFAYLADAHRARGGIVDLLQMSTRLSKVPCGPLFKRHVSPDRELHALIRANTEDG